mmetsp:Transcript_17931/g.41480  ORF Transcript_17931/g.41480 Transcript_17931/m.41480 type:complete len:81 (+) Transcript_17931:964-1206(+)
MAGDCERRLLTFLVWCTAPRLRWRQVLTKMGYAVLTTTPAGAVADPERTNSLAPCLQGGPQSCKIITWARECDDALGVAG